MSVPMPMPVPDPVDRHLESRVFYPRRIRYADWSCGVGAAASGKHLPCVALERHSNDGTPLRTIVSNQMFWSGLVWSVVWYRIRQDMAGYDRMV